MAEVQLFRKDDQPFDLPNDDKASVLALIHDAPEAVTFFYAVAPVANSPSTGVAKSYPTSSPDTE